MKKFFDFLGSAKLAVTLFFILGIISIFGTIIPQGEKTGFYLMKYGEKLGKLIIVLDLNDAYHSWWYVGTLFLFLINLVTCSIKRFPISLKLFKKDPSEIDPEKLPNLITIKIVKDLARIKTFIYDRLGFENIEKIDNLFIKDLNKWAYFAVYIVHFSLIIILIGAIIGALKGFRGYLYLIEGIPSNQIIPMREEKSFFLDFHVKLNKFGIELYPDGTPKEYISNITILDKNFIKDAIIKVNHPFKYKKITFYQASYDQIPQFILKIMYKKNILERKLEWGIPVSLENRYFLILDDYMPHPGGIIAKITIFDEKEGKGMENFLIQGRPTKINLRDGILEMEIKDIKTTYMSVLQVKKDPGLPLVYLGFIIMVIGLFLVYFFEPKTFWIYLKPKDKEIIINLGAIAKRERDTIKLKLKEIAEKLEREA